MLLYNFFPENDAAGGFLIFLTIANENDFHTVFQERFIVVSQHNYHKHIYKKYFPRMKLILFKYQLCLQAMLLFI